VAIIETAYAYVILRIEETKVSHRKSVVAAALLVAAAVVVTALLGACANEPFRLHILANSNSAEDQQVKLSVRDAVLEATKDGILNCKNESEAEEYIKNNLGIIMETANETLAENGFGYTATAETGNFHFPEKSYKGVTYPEGDYRALRIILGDGEGDNWWCVMFPPLCISEITDTQDYEYTSFLAELWEAIFGR
jgi:stage II sporulation protein R